MFTKLYVYRYIYTYIWNCPFTTETHIQAHSYYMIGMNLSSKFVYLSCLLFVLFFYIIIKMTWLRSSAINITIWSTNIKKGGGDVCITKAFSNIKSCSLRICMIFTCAAIYFPSWRTTRWQKNKQKKVIQNLYTRTQGH